MENINHQLIPIDFKEIEFVKIGHDGNEEAKTGVTVLYFPEKATVGVAVFGGGPASRETPLASPLTANTLIDAIVFSGGSAFGLEASTGVVKYLEEKEIGIDAGYATIPIVMQSCIFDLSFGTGKIRPDSQMGYNAMKNAFEEKTEIKSGIYGAGIGASIGKLFGISRASKGGIGFASYKFDDFIVGAVVVVNSMGDIFDGDKKITGLKTADRKNFANFMEELIKLGAHTNVLGYEKEKQNTTIGAVITNANFNKGEMNIIANMVRAAYGKVIRPSATMMDGDTIYAISTGKNKVDIDLNVAGIISEYVMERAIVNAALNSNMEEKEFVKNMVILNK